MSPMQILSTQSILTKTEFEPGNEDKAKADSKKKGRESSEDDRQAPKPVQPQYPPAFGQQQQGQGQGQQGQAQGGWGWTPPSQQKAATPSTPTHSHPYSGFGQPGMGTHPGQSPHNQGQGMQGATPQSFSQYPQVPGPHQQGHQNQQPQQQPQQFHNPYNQPQFAQTMPPGGCPQGICPHGPQMNANQQSPFQQGHGMNPQMQNYSFPEPNHSPQTPTPVNAQFGRNQPPPGQHSPNFGYPPQAPCCPHPHMQQGQMGHGGMMGPGPMGSSQMGPAQMNQNQPGFQRGDHQGMGPGVSHPPMGQGQGQPGFHMGDHQGMGPGVSHPPMGQGMGHPGMGPSFNQGQGPHGHGHGQGFGHPQASFSQENKQKQLRMDQHNYQAIQQQHEVNPRQVHPGTADDIRGTPIHSLDPNGPHGLHPPFHMPGPHNQEPHFYYYSLSYDIPQSHALNQAIGLERFRHPVSEWDMARRHQQQAQGDYRGKPRKAEQGREVKDDRENDRTKESLRETERRGNRGDFNMDREQDRDRDRNRERNARYRDDHSDTDRAPHTTTSEDEHDREHRRINPRNFDTRYPDNVGPFIPYHPYPPGVHVPSPARHLGPHNLSPIVLPTPPNTPLHAQMMHQSMMPFPGHMPHVPMPGPFDSPFNMSYGNFLGPAFPPHYDSYDDRRPRNRDRDRDRDIRDKRRRRDVRRTPSSSPEHMNEEKKDDDKKEQS